MQILFAFVLLTFSGCSEPTQEVPEPPAKAKMVTKAKSKAKGKAKAKAGMKAQLPVLPVGKRHALVPKTSTVGFEGAKITGSHMGGFNAFSGAAVTANGGVVGARLEFEMASTWADHPKLQKHLLNDDFFDVEKFTSAVFVADKIEKASASGVTHTVSGMMQLMGKTAPVKFPVTIKRGEGSIHVVGTHLLNRHDWGVSYPGMPDNLIKDKVKVSIDLMFGE